MIKTFLLSNIPEFQEILQIEKTDHITLEVEINILTLEYRVYGNNFDLTRQDFLGEGVLTKSDWEFISAF